MTNKRRPRIFCQFTDRPSIEPGRGDLINEIRFYRSLSTFADVYYNDCLIDLNSGIIGDPRCLNEPTRDYDLYYVRANHPLFRRLPHPKVTMAYPYDQETFVEADAVFVTTNSWRELLGSYNYSPESRNYLNKWYPENIKEPNRIVNIKQSIDPIFFREPSNRDTFKWRACTTGGSVFGFFGRITEETIPKHLITAVSRVRNELGNPIEPLVAFAGRVRAQLPPDTLDLGLVDYCEMPALVSACTATLGQECADSYFLGSGKVLDSMARRVPVVCRRSPVRQEQLGSNYPCMFDTDEEAEACIYRLCVDAQFRSDVAEHLRQRQTEFSPEQIGQHIYNELLRAKIL